MATIFFVDENDLALGKALDEKYGRIVYPGHPDLPEIQRGSLDDQWLPIIGTRKLVVIRVIAASVTGRLNSRRGSNTVFAGSYSPDERASPRLTAWSSCNDIGHRWKLWSQIRLPVHGCMQLRRIDCVRYRYGFVTCHDDGGDRVPVHGDSSRQSQLEVITGDAPQRQCGRDAAGPRSKSARYQPPADGCAAQLGARPPRRLRDRHGSHFTCVELELDVIPDPVEVPIAINRRDPAAVAST